MSENKLLPCPLCGGKAYTGYALKDYNRWGACEDCGCSVEVEDWKGVEDTEENAIAAWNTRRPMERIAEQMEEEMTTGGSFVSGFRNIGKSFVGGYRLGMRKAIQMIKRGGVDEQVNNRQENQRHDHGRACP